MHREKIKEFLSSKNWREPKNVKYPQLKAMHKLLTDYSVLWIISEASLFTIIDDSGSYILSHIM